MDVQTLLYNRFLKPFETKKTGQSIGVELEFPLVQTDGGDVDREAARGIYQVFLEQGFFVDIAGDSGEPYFIANSAGDSVSFDNSYNNFEFSMQFGPSLSEIAARFYGYLKTAQQYFNAHNLTLLGRGTNPNQPHISQNPVGFSTYRMVDEYLHKFCGTHSYCDFPAYLSSVQTHLDVSLFDLPFAYTVFAKLDFARALLFSNSPDFAKTGYLCYRDYLWEQSGFSRCPNITGKIDGEFETADDLLAHFMEKGMFNRIRNGSYEIFSPVPMTDYFENPKYGAQEADIEQYLSFQTVEITARGTLEVRGDCAQPFDDAFAPPAFNLGILMNLEEAALCVDGFLAENGISMKNSHLRDLVVTGKPLDGISDEDSLADFLYDLVEIAAEGLLKRGYGEERFLQPLYARAATLCCPAKREYQNGQNL